MKNYIGTKQIKAIEMTRGEYNKYRGWKLPENENGEDEGYLVEYLDSPNSNHTKHKNYISWSPKEVFEKAYKISESFLDRLKIEERELDEKYQKLQDFILSEGFEKLDNDRQDVLKRQLEVMASYLSILEERLYMEGA